MTVSRLAAIVEVNAEAGGAVPGGLIRDVYRASREGTMVLVLNGLSTAQADRALDPIVPQLADVAGVVYCTSATLERVVPQSGWPDVAFVDTRELATRLARRGIRVLPTDRAPWIGRSASVLVGSSGEA